MEPGNLPSHVGSVGDNWEPYGMMRRGKPFEKNHQQFLHREDGVVAAPHVIDT